MNDIGLQRHVNMAAPTLLGNPWVSQEKKAENQRGSGFPISVGMRIEIPETLSPPHPRSD